jgi:hypothetical protein
VNAYSIVLQQNATAFFSQNGYTATTTVPTADANTFFSDLNANVPMSKVVTDNGCTKSSSYGTVTTLTYEGTMSGDVSCPPSPSSPAETLYHDATKIEQDVRNNIGPFNH